MEGPFKTMPNFMSEYRMIGIAFCVYSAGLATEMPFGTSSDLHVFAGLASGNTTMIVRIVDYFPSDTNIIGAQIGTKFLIGATHGR